MDALDDSGSAKHAGYEDKEARRKRRMMRLAKAGKEGGIAARGRVAADPEYVCSPLLRPKLIIFNSFNFAYSGLVRLWFCTRIRLDKSAGIT